MLPNNITDFLAALSRRKLLREGGSGETRRDNLSLHRWTLIKNSISHATARSTATPTYHASALSNPKANLAITPESIPIPDDGQGDFFEEDVDLGSLFLFPDAGSLSSDTSLIPPVSPTDDDSVELDFEARWLDDVLADLAADGQDDDAAATGSENPLILSSESPTPVPSPPPPSTPTIGPTIPEPEADISPLSLSFADILPYGLSHLYPPNPNPTLDASSSSDYTCSDDGEESESDDGPVTPGNNSQASFDTTYDLDNSSSGLELFPSPSPNFLDCTPQLFPARF